MGIGKKGLVIKNCHWAKYLIIYLADSFIRDITKSPTSNDNTGLPRWNLLSLNSYLGHFNWNFLPKNFPHSFIQEGITIRDSEYLYHPARTTLDKSLAVHSWICHRGNGLPQVPPIKRQSSHRGQTLNRVSCAQLSRSFPPSLHSPSPHKFVKLLDEAVGHDAPETGALVEWLLANVLAEAQQELLRLWQRHVKLAIQLQAPSAGRIQVVALVHRPHSPHETQRQLEAVHRLEMAQMKPTHIKD